MRLIIVLLLLCPFALLKSQTLTLGPKIAYQSVWLLNQNNYGMSEMDYSVKAGLAYGAAISVDYGEHWGVQLEYQRAHMGQNYEDNIGIPQIFGVNTVFEVRKEVDLLYSQVPLMVRYRNGSDKAVFLGLLGPQVGFRGATTISYQVDGVDIPFQLIPGSLYPGLDQPELFYQTLDFGLAGGAGGEFYIGRNFFIRAMSRFYLGLTDVNDEATRGAPEYQGTRNFSLGLESALGVRFGETQQRTWTRRPGR